MSNHALSCQANLRKTKLGKQEGSHTSKRAPGNIFLALCAHGKGCWDLQGTCRNLSLLQVQTVIEQGVNCQIIRTPPQAFLDAVSGKSCQLQDKELSAEWPTFRINGNFAPPTWLSQVSDCKLLRIQLQEIACIRNCLCQLGAAWILLTSGANCVASLKGSLRPRGDMNASKTFSKGYGACSFKRCTPSTHPFL